MTTVEVSNHFPKAEYFNATVIRESALEVLGIETGSTKKLVAAMVEKFAQEKDVIRCDKCGGNSSSHLSRCPFCGEADEAVVVAEVEAKAEKAIARAKKSALVTADIGEYKKCAKEIEKFKENLCRDFWDLGVTCKRVRDNRLWQSLTNDAGKPTYKSFDSWIVEEAGFVKSYIYGLIGVVESFTEEQVKKFGRTHMLTLTSTETQDRPFLLSELEKREYSTREFNELVERVKAARKTTKVKPKNEPTTRMTSSESTPVATPKAITAVFPLERIELEMLARIQAGEPTKSAMDVSDQPWAKMDLANGVAVFFGLSKRADGQYVLTVQAMRDDA